MEQIRRVMRPTDVPDQGLLCDLLWADPDKDVLGWGENDRGVSFTFGADVVTKFLHKHDMDLICRAHQVSAHLCAKQNKYVAAVGLKRASVPSTTEFLWLSSDDLSLHELLFGVFMDAWL